MKPTAADQVVDGPASAELAMVDPALRLQLIEAEQADSVSSERLIADAPADTPAVSRRPRPSAPNSRRRLLAGAAVCVTAAAVALLALGVFRASPAGTGRTAGIPSVPPNAGAHAGVEPAPRLVWAPVAGVTEYEIAVYRRSTPLFRTRTHVASATILPLRSLAAGNYEWYVWAVRHGVRDRVAVVRSRLHIGGN